MPCALRTSKVREACAAWCKRRLRTRWGAWRETCAVMALLAFAVAGCSEAQREREQSETGLVVVASIDPLADLAEELMGELGEAHALLPAGSTPHGFSPTPDALRTLRSADVLLTVGRGLDPWAAQLAGRLDEPPTEVNLAEIAVQAGVVDGGDTPESSRAKSHDHAGHNHDHDHAAHDHDHAAHNNDHAGHDHHDHHDHADHHDHDHLGPNPHLWLDPHAARAFVEELAVAVESRLPEDQHATLRANREALLGRIDEIDRAYRQQLKELSRTRLVTFHNAFDPLAERYGLEVVAHLTPIGLGGGGEITPGRLDAAVRAIQQHDVPAVYVEPQFSDAVARRIAERTGVEVLTLDPLGHPHIEGRRGWFDIMRFNLEQLVKGQTS